jgi:hypothetical protein
VTRDDRHANAGAVAAACVVARVAAGDGVGVAVAADVAGDDDTVVRVAPDGEAGESACDVAAS